MVELAGATIAILTRAPSAGGKSRLFRALGVASDPLLLTALLLDTVDATTAVGAPRLVAVEPAAACEEVRALLPGVMVIPQIEGTLGARMAAAMAAAFDRGASAVALIGSDLPDIRPQSIVHAFDILHVDPESLVLGPASDGGYYLVAARRVPPVFGAIAWGTAHVLAQTILTAGRQGMPVHLVEPMADVDSPGDLARVAAPRTRAWRASRGFD
jgi:rSAM/selenodomain-associated transferase 1